MKTEIINQVKTWEFWAQALVFSPFAFKGFKTLDEVLYRLIGYYCEKHGAYLKITSLGELVHGDMEDEISTEELLQWVEFVTPYYNGSIEMPYAAGYYLPYRTEGLSIEDIADIQMGEGYSEWMKSAEKIISSTGEIPVPPVEKWMTTSAYRIGLRGFAIRFKLIGR